jgi:hypothetical protein
MSLEQHWLTTRGFAEAVGITPRAAGAVLRAAYGGTGWRGHKLVIRRTFGRGGAGGLAYEVAWASLPADVHARMAPDGGASGAIRRTAACSDARALARLRFVEEALKHSARSSARNAAVRSAAAAAGVSGRTLYRWLARYEQSGIRGLGRVRARNADAPRIQISRCFDRAFRKAGHGEAALEEVAQELDQALKGLWASRAEQAGALEVKRLAEFLLLQICERRRMALPAESLRLSRRRVERFAHYRVVNQRRNDRKAFDDAKPRIRRDWTGLAPMERVIADVKHLDIIVRRPDGSATWPKIVAFMDAGTGRVFVYPLLLERGEGVRQEHVIEAFLAMVADPAWGFPQGLYLDNGAEFGALVKIDRALQSLNAPGVRTIIYARPYNASAKPIESLFARLDRYVFGLLPGYAGPDRMAKKTQAVGKPPAPYPGDWDRFCARVLELIQAHNLRPVGGTRGGRSPQDWFVEKVADGWRPTAVDPSALDAAFADTDCRRVDRGVLKINGQRYSHEAIAALPARTVVDLALPWRRGARPLARVGGEWVYLEPETLYPARWIEGARESSRRQAAQTRHVGALAKDAPRLDPVRTKIEWAKRQDGAVRAAARHRLDLGADVHERGRSAREAAERSPQPSAAELKRTREMALTELLEAQQRDV